MRVGLGHDTHRLVKDRPLILGGVRIAFDQGLAGHSDADIVFHAVSDAILGAAGLGDIGELFPDTDAQFAGIESHHILIDVVKKVQDKGWQVENCDVIIHAQKPKLSQYKGLIAQNLVRLLHVADDAVNVKAKTGEHVGPIGRGEAMSCHAVVLLKRHNP